MILEVVVCGEMIYIFIYVHSICMTYIHEISMYIYTHEMFYKHIYIYILQMCYICGLHWIFLNPLCEACRGSAAQVLVCAAATSGPSEAMLPGAGAVWLFVCTSVLMR